jgi:hypothetical protein
MLAAHEENCEGMGSLVRATAFRYPLTETAKTMPASTIVVASSSGFPPPSGWFADKSTLEEGLSIWGQSILRHFVAYTGATGPQSAVVHAGYNVRMRGIPVLLLNESFLQEKETRHWSLYRAYKFTKALVTDIEAANKVNVVPTLLSVGIDGWACDARIITPLWAGSYACGY